MTKPTAAFNACDDFFVTVITGHVVAAALEVMKDMPGLGMEWMNTAEEREACLEEVCGRIINKFVDFTFHKLPTECEDQVFRYAVEIMSIGCFYLEFSDAIREGDGNRILRCCITCSNF